MSINDFEINLDNISHFILNKENQKFWNDLYIAELKLNFVNCKEWFFNHDLDYLTCFFGLKKEEKKDYQILKKIIEFTSQLCYTSANKNYWELKGILNYLDKVTIKNEGFAEVVRNVLRKTDINAFCKVGLYALYILIDLILEIWQELVIQYEMS